MSDEALAVASLPSDGSVEEIATAIENRAGDTPARVAVDVDRTLTTGEGDPWYVDGLGPEPSERAVAVVNELYRRGHTILIWTARPWSVAGDTAAWLTAHGVRYHGLRMAKGSGDVYLDDKAIDARGL